MSAVEYAMSKGYPKRIIGNGGYKACLVNFQRLNDGDIMGIYRYPGGDCCHSLSEILSARGIMILAD